MKRYVITNYNSAKWMSEFVTWNVKGTREEALLKMKELMNEHSPEFSRHSSWKLHIQEDLLYIDDNGKEIVK